MKRLFNADPQLSKVSIRHRQDELLELKKSLKSSNKKLKKEKVNDQNDIQLLAEFNHNQIVKSRRLVDSKCPFWFVDGIDTDDFSSERSISVALLDQQNQWEYKMKEQLSKHNYTLQ